MDKKVYLRYLIYIYIYIHIHIYKYTYISDIHNNIHLGWKNWKNRGAGGAVQHEYMLYNNNMVYGGDKFNSNTFD